MTTAVARTSSTIHREVVLEEHLVARLVEGQGYLLRLTADYDRASALDRELLLRFVRETQPDAWQRLEGQYGATAEAELLKQVEKALKSRGTLDVLRSGIKLVPNVKVRLCDFAPASGLNPELVRRYEANLLSVVRQLRYSSKGGQAIDVVLFVNGIPVATMELKNRPTGTTFRHAEKQYREDRSPAGEPLLTFKRGALVHLALDEDNVSMTTRLLNGKTRFLPFNRGRDGGAGNPDVPEEYRVAYLYADSPEGKAVLGRETWLRILGQYAHLERDEDGAERMLFPRYHQLDATRRLLAHARAHGSGQSYLIEHSAGSGKSNTIAWLAHQLSTLHDARDERVFDSVIVVTDRRVLDSQLQATVSQFQRTKDYVRAIDGTSAQLREALKDDARIVVSTIQKFGTEHLRTLDGQAGKRFALIVDEAHSSQSGKSAQALADALTREATSSEDVEAIILAYQKARGPQPTISYVALTATPRNVTLERFGQRGEDGTPRPFHRYSMRQAIEEGFILDVLRNYMTYRAYYELEKAIEADPKLKTQAARRRVARFAHLHPTAIEQKVEVIVEHFRHHVMGELDGHAKAMVVTASRESALRTYFGMDRYLKARGYADIRPLVAFSGEIEVDGERWSEAQVNGFSEAALRTRFDEEDDLRLLVVAEKYQTGFDQPKLVGMYVDRKLAGLQAVQTLSRLNRTAPGKDRTFVLDMQNTAEEIQEAFRPYFEGARLEEVSNPNQIYELEARLRTFDVIDPGEVSKFAEIFFLSTLTPQDRITLQGRIRPAVARWETLDEGRQEEFRQLLSSFLRFYAFVGQVVQLGDADLERLATYGDWLLRLLPDRDVPAEVEITDDMLRLHAFKIARTGAGDASLDVGDEAPLRPIREFGANAYTAEEELSLSEIIHSFNERHGTEFTKEDFLRFEQVNRDILTEDMVEMLRNNPPDVVYQAFRDAFFRGAIKLFQRDEQLKSVVLSDAHARDQATRHFFARALRTVRP